MAAWPIIRSVQVTDVMTIERYSHVMHITSNVSGHLAAGRSAFDALQVCLPAGTVSGAPKVRAMEIIDELEPCRRGPYGGAVGYVDFAGNMDTCIALRTIVIHDDTAYVQAGAGLVADSVPENEWNETLNKARGLLKAIELAEGRGGVTRTQNWVGAVRVIAATLNNEKGTAKDESTQIIDYAYR